MIPLNNTSTPELPIMNLLEEAGGSRFIPVFSPSFQLLKSCRFWVIGTRAIVSAARQKHGAVCTKEICVTH